MKLNDMRMSVKLKLGFGFLLALIVATAGVNWVSQAGLDSANNTLARQEVPEMMIADDCQISVWQSATRTRNVLILVDIEKLMSSPTMGLVDGLAQ